MRGAPPVALVCDGGVVWRGVQASLHALVAAALVAWVAGHMGFGAAMQAFAAAAGAAPAAVVAWLAAAPQARSLAWDGEQWRLGPADHPGTVEVMIDLGGWLLLRHRSTDAAAAPAWLAVSATAGGGAMHGLRAALHAGPASPRRHITSPERPAR
jgi:hypothetical protein